MNDTLHTDQRAIYKSVECDGSVLKFKVRSLLQQVLDSKTTTH